MPTGLRTMVFAVLLMALPVASYILMFKPRDAEIKLAEADIRARRDKLAALKQATAEVKDLPEEIEKLRKAIAFFQNKLPDEKEMDKVLGEVWQIAEKNGLNTKSVRTMKAIPGETYSEQPIRMVIVGPFSGFYTFLRSVEQLPRITRVNDLSMEKDPKVEGQMTADLVLTIYFESQKSGPAVAVNK